MRAAPPSRPRSDPAGTPVLLSVALVSAALIAYEIVLMRRLLIERWHHFGYLVISVALLGFGASGTLLALLDKPLRRRPPAALWLAALGLALSFSLMPRLAGRLPVSARFIPGDLPAQLGWWSLYWLCAGLPFLLGATQIGAALMTAGQRVGRAYAASLFGSGVGALAGGLLAAGWLPRSQLWPALAGAWLATLVLSAWRAPGAGRHGPLPRCALALALAGGAVALEVCRPLGLHPDQFKYLSYVRRLAGQGAAERIARAADLHGYVEIYASALFHDLPFLAPGRPPPPMYRVLINGDPAGSVFRIAEPRQAAVMDATLMALAYRLLPHSPRVLLLGETGGTGVWLARRRDARQIVALQPNRALLGLLRGPLSRACGGVLRGADVQVVSRDPRSYLAAARRRQAPRFDLVQMVCLEGLGLAPAGTHGLAEDHLLTVEGFADALRVLGPDGLVSICRGVQFPARENIRLLATLAEALELLGVERPGRQLIQVRDYLGVCTLALNRPLDRRRRQALRAALGELQLTPVWYDGVRPDELNRPDALSGPAEGPGDWLAYAARQIFSPQRQAFYRSWLSNVRPVHDDNPFFWDFYKRQGLSALRAAYGELWLTRAELGRLFLYASLVIAGAGAVLLILVPLGLARLRRGARRPARRRSRGRPAIWTVAYFAAIGLGFMGVEMALISRATRSLGDPVIASALVIGGLLVVSGLGSLTGRRLTARRAWRPAAAVAALGALVTLSAWSPDGYRLGGPWGPALLGLLAVPLSYCMGVPLPAGIAALARRAPELVAWAWGINGVASVLGSALAVVLAMSAGYRYVFLLASALYAAAALAGLALARAAAPPGSPPPPLSGADGLQGAG